MANQNTLFDLSVTPANNLNIKGQSQQGTAPGSTIDNIFQRYGAALKAFYDSFGGAQTAGGTATALTLTVTEDWAAYARGLRLNLKAPSAATGASTLAITVPTAGALGAKAIRRQGDTAIQANDWLANGHLELEYDDAYNSAAGAWVLLNPAVTSISTPITEANGGTNQTTYSQGDLLYASAANTLAKLAKGTTGQSLTQTSTIPAWGSAIVLGTSVASTSGTSIDFTSIPSWVRHIVISFVGVSTNGTSNYIVQIGDSGGVETTGYLAASALGGTSTSGANYTTGFGIIQGNAGNIIHGSMILTLVDATANTWAAGHFIGFSNAANADFGGGSKSLSPGPLDRVRITMVNGTDTFDAGTINIAYW